MKPIIEHMPKKRVEMGDIHHRNVLSLKLHSAVQYGKDILASKQRYKQTNLPSVVLLGSRVLEDKKNITNLELIQRMEDIYQSIAYRLAEDKK